MISMVVRVYIEPFSGSNGASEANSTRSGPKNFSPHLVASQRAEQRGVGVEHPEIVERPLLQLAQQRV